MSEACSTALFLIAQAVTDFNMAGKFACVYNTPLISLSSTAPQVETVRITRGECHRLPHLVAQATGSNLGFGIEDVSQEWTYLFTLVRKPTVTAFLKPHQRTPFPHPPKSYLTLLQHPHRKRT